MSGLHHQRRRQSALAAVAALALLTSAGCATAPSSQPRINVTLAQQRSAELTAANAFYEATLRSAAQEHDAGRLSDAGLAAVRAAGTSTHSALVQASAELNLYLSGGGNDEALSAAFTRLAQSRCNLSLSWDAAQREIGGGADGQ